MTINEIKNLNKKSFIHYKTGKKTELHEATGLKIVIENENMIIELIFYLILYLINYFIRS